MESNNYTWLTVKETAQLLCMTERNVQILCQNDKVLTKTVPGHGKGRGSKVLMIALESMTKEVQQSFFQNKELENSTFYNSLTVKEREKIDFKFNTIMEYRKFCSEPHKEGRMKLFLEKINREYPAASVTAAQVNRWNRVYEEKGIQGLYDSRGTHNRGQDTIPEEAWNTYYSLWFHYPRATLQQCYEMTCEKYREQIPHMPSRETFRRKIEKLPQPVKILRNEGKKGFDDKCMPHMDIDYEALASNEQWVADHHVFDVLVEGKSGGIFRPWLTAWLDRRSRYIVGYEINPCPPNSDIVLSSFIKACSKSGIPETVLLDNGKDFKAYDLFNNENGKSIAGQMGIKVTNAIVRNAKAKPIERYFKTLEEKYFAMMPCYIAGKPHLRPEKMSMTNKKLKLKKLCMPYEEFLERAQQIIQEVNNTPHHGRGMNGRTPYEVYKENFSRPARMVKDEDVLNILLQRTSRPIKVGRNGVRLKATGFYYNSSALFDRIGQEVYARYNSEDVSKIYVYNTEDQFLCIAECNELVQLGTPVSTETIKKFGHYKKERRERMKDLEPSQPDYTIGEFLHSREVNHQEYDVKKDPTAIPAITSRHKDIKQILAAEEATTPTPAPAGTISFADRQKRKEEVDRALYEFMKKAGGDNQYDL